jgi:hypothetical protein
MSKHEEVKKKVLKKLKESGYYRSKHQPEDIIKTEVFEYLEARGHEVFPHKTSATYDPKLGMYRQISYRSATVGEADLLVFHFENPCFPIWIEMKTLKGQERAAQIRFKERVIGLGHEYHIVKGIDDCIKLLF